MTAKKRQTAQGATPAPVESPGGSRNRGGPSPAVVQSAMDVLKAEMESPAFAQALADNEVTVEVQGSVTEELRDLDERIAAADRQAAEYQDAALAAQQKGDDAEFDKQHRLQMRALNTANTLAARRNILRTPEEIVRRVNDRLARLQQRQRLNALRKERSTGMAKDKTSKSKKAPKVTAQSQGFPEVYLGPTGNFRIGMDARAKSDLVLSVVGATKGEAKKMLYTFTEAEAVKLLEARDWMKYLTRRREIMAEKAAKAEQRKAATKERIAAKKNGAAESSPDTKAKLAAAAKAQGGVTPDPRPTRKKKSRSRS